jgi:RimJ/RimL family protein N-acetyltransferase
LTRPIEFPVEGVSDGEIRLRLLTEADLPALVEIVSDPEIPRWTRIPDAYGDSDAREWYEVQGRGRDEGRILNLMIVDGGDRLLGACGIVEVDWTEGRAELGYWLAREARGRGVMTRAIPLLVSWIFESLPIERVQLGIEPANAASRALAERTGFTFEGVLRSWFVNKGKRRDVAMYSLLRTDILNM